MRRLTDQEWETFATRMKPIATRRLSQLRRADGDSDDVLASVWRTYHERAGKDLDARRLEENYNGDVFKLLLYHLFRKINRARKQETSLKRSAQRSADLDPSSESFFWSQFNSDKEPEASDVDLFLDRLFEPLEKVSSFTRAVAELKIAGFAWYEIEDALGASQYKVRKVRIVLEGLLNKYSVMHQRK